MKNEAGLTLTGIRVLVRLPKIEKMTKGGIALPDYTYDKENQAQVTGVFVDAADDAAKCSEIKGIKPGDNVFFARYSGAGCEFSIGGTPYRVMNATDVIGIVDPEINWDGKFKAAQSTVEVFGLADKAA